MPSTRMAFYGANVSLILAKELNTAREWHSSQRKCVLQLNWCLLDMVSRRCRSQLSLRMPRYLCFHKEQILFLLPVSATKCS